MGTPSNQTPAARTTARTTGWGKSRAADLVTAALQRTVRSPAAVHEQDGAEQDGVERDGVERDDVAVEDLLVHGVRLADLDPTVLDRGSAAWNAAAAYQLKCLQPHAAAHYEGVAREWAALANSEDRS